MFSIIASIWETIRAFWKEYKGDLFLWILMVPPFILTWIAYFGPEWTPGLAEQYALMAVGPTVGNTGILTDNGAVYLGMLGNISTLLPIFIKSILRFQDLVDVPLAVITSALGYQSFRHMIFLRYHREILCNSLHKSWSLMLYQLCSKTGALPAAIVRTRVHCAQSRYILDILCHVHPQNLPGYVAAYEW